MDPAIATICVAVVGAASAGFAAWRANRAATDSSKAKDFAEEAHAETKLVRVEINGHMQSLLRVNEELKQAAMVIARREGIEEGLAQAAVIVKARASGAQDERDRNH
jgi:hypothetical protein